MASGGTHCAVGGSKPESPLPVTPVALKVMDTGGQPAELASGLLIASLCGHLLVAALIIWDLHTEAELDLSCPKACYTCALRLPSAGDVNAFLKEASMMQRLVDCPQVGTVLLLTTAGSACSSHASRLPAQLRVLSQVPRHRALLLGSFANLVPYDALNCPRPAGGHVPGCVRSGTPAGCCDGADRSESVR